MRAGLEVAINNLLDVLGPEITADSDYTSDSEETPIMISNEEVTHIVRKQLTPALRDLMQHGLMPVRTFIDLLKVSVFHIYYGDCMYEYIFDVIFKFFHVFWLYYQDQELVVNYTMSLPSPLYPRLDRVRVWCLSSRVSPSGHTNLQN